MTKKTKRAKVLADIRKKEQRQAPIASILDSQTTPQPLSYETQLSTVTQRDLLKTISIVLLLFALEYGAFLAVKRNYFGIFN